MPDPCAPTQDPCAPPRRRAGAIRTAAGLAALVLLAPPGLAAGGPAGAVVPVPLATAASGSEPPSFPPCIDVAFEVDPVTGLPPLTFSWLSDTGEMLSGNPAVLDTAFYAAGPHQLTVTVTNAFGNDQAVAPFTVEALAAGTPLAAQNPVPGLEVTIEGAAAGYDEWRFVWGDGQTTPWQPACVTASSHTYAVAGTYPVRLEARSCVEPAVSSDPLLVTVGGTALQVTEFRVLGCEYGPCLFTAGEELTFVQAFTLPPAVLYYDWDGDGAVDEISALPVATHNYDDPGAYRPEVTAEWGSVEATKLHAEWIYVSSDPQPIEFYDGFEDGEVGCWSAVSGAGPSPPGPGCFIAP